MNAKTVTRARYPRGLGKAELLAEWEAQLSLQLVEHKGGCVEWTGPLDSTDGATCRAPKELARLLAINHTQTVVRALWIIKYGKVPNFNLMPACRSPWCVAPEHRLSMGSGRLRACELARKRKGGFGSALEWRIATRLRAERRNEQQRARRALNPQPTNNYPGSTLSERQRERKLVYNRALYWRQVEARRAAGRLRAKARRADPVQRERINARQRERRALKRLQAQQVQP